jgi:hypothetical protein
MHFMCFYILYNNTGVNMWSQINDRSWKYSRFYVIFIQPDDGYLASQNMQLLLVLICKNKSVLVGMYLYYCCVLLTCVEVMY